MCVNMQFSVLVLLFSPLTRSRLETVIIPRPAAPTPARPGLHITDVLRSYGTSQCRASGRAPSDRQGTALTTFTASLRLIREMNLAQSRQSVPQSPFDTSCGTPAEKSGPIAWPAGLPSSALPTRTTTQPHAPPPAPLRTKPLCGRRASQWRRSIARLQHPNQALSSKDSG